VLLFFAIFVLSVRLQILVSFA